MTRITKSLTEQIVEKALDKAGITAARKELQRNLQDWAEHARVEALGGPDEVARIERVLDEIKRLRGTLPSGLDQGAVIARKVQHDYILVGGDRVNFHLPEYRLSVYQIEFGARHPMSQAYRKIESRRVDVEKRADEIIAKVRGTVQQFTTIKKLLEAWPEAVELIPATVDTGAKLPVIRTEDLNKLVGLP